MDLVGYLIIAKQEYTGIIKEDISINTKTLNTIPNIINTVLENEILLITNVQKANNALGKNLYFYFETLYKEKIFTFETNLNRFYEHFKLISLEES